MCFKTSERNNDESGIGWKIFVKEKNKLFSTACAPYAEQRTPRHVNRWLTANAINIWSRFGSVPHHTGWMIFEDEKEACDILAAYNDPNEVTRKVAWRESEFLGTVKWSCDMETAVRQAKFIKILPASQQ